MTANQAHLQLDAKVWSGSCRKNIVVADIQAYRQVKQQGQKLADEAGRAVLLPALTPVTLLIGQIRRISIR